MQTDSEQIEQRIPVKEQELQQLQHSNIMLQEETKKLTVDLNNKQITLDELDARLEKYKRANAKLVTENESQQRKKAYLDQRIRESQRKINTVRNDKKLPDREKQKKIEELKNEAKEYLKMGL
jgi:chromosome segregation ATPase